MNQETKQQPDQDLATEIAQAELEAVAAALRVRSGVQAGFAPCI